MHPRQCCTHVVSTAARQILLERGRVLLVVFHFCQLTPQAVLRADARDLAIIEENEFICRLGLDPNFAHQFSISQRPWSTYRINQAISIQLQQWFRVKVFKKVVLEQLEPTLFLRVIVVCCEK